MHSVLYKSDYTKKRWSSILTDLDLPADTDQIAVKSVHHITVSGRKKRIQEQKEFAKKRNKF